MRYAIVNQDFFGNGLQITAHYGDFQPTNLKQQRYSDEQALCSGPLFVLAEATS
jgi:hypothetical protein